MITNAVDVITNSRNWWVWEILNLGSVLNVGN